MDVSRFNLKNIACVVDFHEGSRLALSIAGRLALESSAQLYAIHSIDRLAAFGNLMWSGPPGIYTGFHDYAGDASYQQVLRDMMKRALPESISAILVIVYGSRIQNIVNLLRQHHADLCVVGLKNDTGRWHHLFTPMGTQRIIRRSPCPVLTIHAQSFHGEYYAGPTI